MSIQPTPADHRRLDVYLARVRLLTPAEWGRLDAIGVRLADNTPWARWRRGALDADRFEMFTRHLPRGVAVGSAAFIRAMTDAGRWLGAQPAPDPLAPPRRRVQMPTDPRFPDPTPEVRAYRGWAERWVAGVAEIRRAAREAPATGRAADGGAAAARVLEVGFFALAFLHPDAGVIARIYAPVEPVIPYASLDGTQPRLPSAAG